MYKAGASGEECRGDNYVYILKVVGGPVESEYVFKDSTRIGQPLSQEERGEERIQWRPRLQSVPG